MLIRCIHCNILNDLQKSGTCKNCGLHVSIPTVPQIKSIKPKEKLCNNCRFLQENEHSFFCKKYNFDLCGAGSKNIPTPNMCDVSRSGTSIREEYKQFREKMDKE